MIATTLDLKESLRQHFGFDQFKGRQEQIIESVLSGKDTFVIMPTGGGKSLCYQLPAMILDGTAIVISPLIALMKNQVDSIRGHSTDDTIAHFLNSTLSKTQTKQVKEDVQSGRSKLLFVAPETLTKEDNIEFFRSINVSFLAIDEAHCISEWGHDFRPEYRRIREIIEKLEQDFPIMALTATATEKVRADIIKNLEMKSPAVFIDSFNRENLFYEVRAKLNKDETIRQMVRYIKSHAGKSGIIYVQSRKNTEEIAKVLQINGVKAEAYHAGLDSKTRSRVQDEFLMEDIDVICATIAFGMGIDKPDVRFVIHYDIPKSIENYYQETGRAGRDGLEGRCIAFFAHKDINKLEKFLRDKPVAERELASQLMDEVVGYAETGGCRRTYLLHYFSEEYDDSQCTMCDNCVHPKPLIDVTDDMVLALKAIVALNENYTIKFITDFLLGKKSQEMKDFDYVGHELFGRGSDKNDVHWFSVLRQAILHDLVYKEIEQYGLLKMKPTGVDYILNPSKIEIAINHDYTSDDATAVITSEGGSGGAVDELLMKMLMDLRKREADRQRVQPWMIFQENSLEEMASQYPISIDDMSRISGVSTGKAQRFAKPFIEMIADYVEAHEIERPTDFVMKQMANKSKSKIAIIQGVDRKLPLEDIARQSDMSMDSLLDEMNSIVLSGTRLDIDYYITEQIDEDILEEIEEYFSEAETDSIELAYDELKEEDITLEEIQIVRLSFLSKHTI